MSVEFQGPEEDVRKAQALTKPSKPQPSAKKKSVVSAIQDLGREANDQGQTAARATIDRMDEDNARNEAEVNSRTEAVKNSTNRLIDSFRKGGTAKKSGRYKLHRGERAAKKRGGCRG